MITIRVTELPFSPDKPVLLSIIMSDDNHRVLKVRYGSISDIFFSNITRDYLTLCQQRNEPPRSIISLFHLLEIVGRNGLLLILKRGTSELASTPKKRIL